MKSSIIRFEFNSPLHIGSVREDYASSESMIHSDSLYAAIMHTWGMLGWKVPRNPGFGISSLFPFTHLEDDPVYFFPKPFIMSKATITDKDGLVKKIKKVQWLDKHYFQLYIHQKSFQEFGENDQDLQKAFLSQKKLEKPIMDRVIVPRTQIPREYGDTTIYYIERISFSQNSGFYCLVDFPNDTIKKKVETALEILQHEGLGTDRAVGNGQFSYTIDTIEIDIPKPNGYYSNLSLFCPENRSQLSKMLGEKARYELIKRGGYITQADFNSLKKQEVYMFREGSVFHHASSEHLIQLGATPNLQPKIMETMAEEKSIHPIWRCGQALFIPVKL